MMNYIWVGLVIISVIAGGATGNMHEVVNNLFKFAGESVNICIGLIGIMSFFCGLMKVMEKAGICDLIAKALSPIMTRLFPDVPKDHPAMSAMVLWMAANMLGIGNAATPFGLKAMRDLQTLNPTKNVATNAQCMMLAIGTTSVTLLPVSLLAMRSAVKVQGAAEILMPVIIATCISTFVGILFTWLFQKTKRWKWENVIEREIAQGSLELNENYIGDSPIVLPEGYQSKLK